MRFKNTTIPPEGRNEYGNYYSSDRIAKNVMRVTYNGNASTGGNQKKDPVVTPQDNVILFLSKTSLKYEGKDVATSAQTQSIDVLGYVNTLEADTYIGNLTNSAATNYGIVGIPASGMTIKVTDNGTPNTKIDMTINDKISPKKGTLIIPCTVNKKPETTPIGKDWEDWYVNGKNNMTLMLECQWEVSTHVENSYVLELTNELAGINCDYDGNIYPNAVRPTCKAILYLGTKEVEGETYSISTDADRNAQGVSINTATGELTFGSNFSFDGTALEVRISANYKGSVVTKVMTITKQYAGKDGKGAVTRWVVPSVDTVKYNPNTRTMTPNKISCKVMKQEGEEAPVEDTDTTIYYGYNTTNPTSVYYNEITIDASKDYLSFALKNDKNEIYEIETVQIIKEGENGGPGSQGESVYRLALSNENASINADSYGNIYSNARRPTCTATLYYGTTEVSNATYGITTNPNATGVSINSTTGELTFGSNFNFAGTSLEITVTAMVGGILYGTAIMSVSKSIAGEDGSPGDAAISYWLDLSTTEVVVTKGSTVATPNSVTLRAYQQIGGDSPIDITSLDVIRWGYQTSNPQNTTTTISNINTGYTYIMVHLIIDDVIYDRQTIAILKDGNDGSPGEQGRQGAAIRGPVDWRDQTTSRRWCNGTLTNASYPEDAEFIDIVVFDGTYYKCKTSYNGKGGTTAPSSTYWTATDKQYEFVSTNLLLADNAKIKFATNNELYLTDDYGNVTAGAAGGNGTSFWAGANEPYNAKFKVNYDGSMEATKGKFGTYSIEENSDNINYLISDELYYGDDIAGIVQSKLAPHMFTIEVKEEETDEALATIQIAPRNGQGLDLPLYDQDFGSIIVQYGNSLDTRGVDTDKKAFLTNGMVAANGYQNVQHLRGTKYFAPFMPLHNMEITFITDTNYFTFEDLEDSKYLYWRGISTNQTVPPGPYEVREYNGEWCVMYVNGNYTHLYYQTGIYTSNYTKENNRLYIVI